MPDYQQHTNALRALYVEGASKYDACAQVMQQAHELSVAAKCVLRVKLSCVWRTCSDGAPRAGRAQPVEPLNAADEQEDASCDTNDLPCLCRSSSTPNTYYTVDPAEGTCTCPDYVFRKNDTTAVCKHVRYVRAHPKAYTLYRCT